MKTSITKFIILIVYFIIFIQFFGCNEANKELKPDNGQKTKKTEIYHDKETGRNYVLNQNWKVDYRSNHSNAKTLINLNGVDIIVVSSTDNRFLQTHPSIGATIPPDYVCIGGGAYAEVPSGGYGAFLYESRPMDNFQGWLASSKDHQIPTGHYLTVYAVGLRLYSPVGGTPIPATTLKNYLKIESLTSSTYSSAAEQTTTVPPGYVVVGGGARVNFAPGSYGSHLLTASVPSVVTGNYVPNNTWYASSHDHQRYSPATITTYAIGIQSDIHQLGIALEVVNGYWTGARTTRGEAHVSLAYPNIQTRANLNDGWIMTCPGAQSIYEAPTPRMLFSIIPEGYLNMRASSKDQIQAVAGKVIGHAVYLRKKR